MLVIIKMCLTACIVCTVAELFLIIFWKRYDEFIGLAICIGMTLFCAYLLGSVM